MIKKLGIFGLCALLVSNALAKSNDVKDAAAGEILVDSLPKYSVQAVGSIATAEVLVFVQPSYFNKYGEYEAVKRISAWFDLANESYAAHDKKYRLKIMDIEPVTSIDNDIPYHDVLDDDGNIVQDGAGYLFSMNVLNSGNTEYDIYQKKWKADFVVYVREKRAGDGSNGFAGIGGELSTVLDDGSTPDRYSVLAHEIGHNLGMDHESGNATDESGYAHAFECGDKNTIMWSNANEGTFWNHYSTPEIKQVGEVCGNYETAHNARILSENFVASTQRRTGTETAGSVSFDQVMIDSTEGDGIVFEVVRTGDVSEPASVKVFAENGTAIFGEDFTNNFVLVEFEAGQDRVQSVFPLLDDGISEDAETMSLYLQYPYRLSLGDKKQADVNVVDGQASGEAGEFVLSGAEAIDEGNAGTYTIARNGGSGQVSVKILVEGDNAFEGSDYLTPVSFVAFEDGEIEKTFTLQTVQNTKAELNKDITISLASNNDTATFSEAKIVTIIDDDEGDYGTFSLSANDTIEAGKTISVKVTRSGGDDAVELELLNSEGESQTVLFEKGETSKTVGVTAPQSSGTVVLSLSSEKQGITLPDTVNVMVSISSTPVTEQGSTGDKDSGGGGSMGWFIPALVMAATLRRVTLVKRH